MAVLDNIITTVESADFPECIIRVFVDDRENKYGGACFYQRKSMDRLIREETPFTFYVSTGSMTLTFQRNEEVVDLQDGESIPVYSGEEVNVHISKGSEWFLFWSYLKVGERFPPSLRKNLQRGGAGLIAETKKWANEDSIVNDSEGNYSGKVLELKLLGKSSFHYHKKRHKAYFVKEGLVLFQQKNGAQVNEALLPQGSVAQISPGLITSIMALIPSTVIVAGNCHLDAGSNSDTYRENDARVFNEEEWGFLKERYDEKAAQHGITIPPYSRLRGGT